MLEVEAKVRADHVAVRGRLERLGGRCVGTHEEVDTFFAHPGRDFGTTDEALRFRSISHGAAPPRLELTYKGPKQAGRVKARVEHTVGLQEDPTELLRALGFEPRLRIQKQRESWHLGHAHVTLDKLAGLGSFVEVESMTRVGAAAPKVVVDTLRELGLEKTPTVKESYLELAFAAGLATRL